MTDRLTDIIKRCELVENRDLRLKDSISPITVMAADCRWLMGYVTGQRQEIADLRALLRQILTDYHNDLAVSDLQRVAEALGLVWDKETQRWVEKA